MSTEDLKRSYDLVRPRAWKQMIVCGRGYLDSQRVLASQHAPDNPILWAIQGHLGGQCVSAFGEHYDVISSDRKMELARQLVVGHAEYRTVVHNSVHFRRAFAEIYRNRSFFFLGSSLQDSYLLQLFDEAMELTGHSLNPHYALVKKGLVDKGFLKQRYQIHITEYEDHKELPECLRYFRNAIKEHRPKASGWAYNMRGMSRLKNKDGPPQFVPDLQVVCSRLPESDEDIKTLGDRQEALVLGAGVGESDELDLSSTAKNILKSRVGDLSNINNLISPNISQEMRVGKIKDSPFFIVAARGIGDGKHTIDFRRIAPCVRTLVGLASGNDIKVLHSMLLATGKGRFTPSYVSLVEIVRGYCQAYSELDAAGRRAPRMVIYIIDPGVIHLLSSGRIDLAKMLGSGADRTRHRIKADSLYFWLEIDRGAEHVERLGESRNINECVFRIMDDYDIRKDDYEIKTVPELYYNGQDESSPTREKECPGSRSAGASATCGRRRCTLRDLGVTNYSTIRFVRQGESPPSDSA